MNGLLTSLTAKPALYLRGNRTKSRSLLLECKFCEKLQGLDCCSGRMKSQDGRENDGVSLDKQKPQQADWQVVKVKRNRASKISQQEPLLVTVHTPEFQLLQVNARSQQTSISSTNTE